MAKKFPSLTLEPGTYPAEWVWADERFAGELEVSGGKPARVRIFGEPADRRGRQQRGFPDEAGLDRVEGRLRMGYDVVCLEPHLETWFPGQTNGFVRHALVGLGIDEVDGQRYSRARLQITGVTSLMDKGPVAELRLPTDENTWEGKEFGFRVSDQSSYEWKSDQMTIHIGFEGHLSGMDGYRFEMLFAPVINLDSAAPLDVAEWVDRWLLPLYHLVSFATKAPQKVSWITLVHDLAADDPRSRRRAQLFGSGIEQEPYLAERPVFVDDKERPVFTLGSLTSVSLPALIGRWAALLEADDPFLELFRSVMFSPDLPPRAQFLYLIQSLETLHATENEAGDADAQERFEAQRAEVLERIKEATAADDYKFLKATWPKRRIDSLTRRLDDLLASAPPELRSRLATLADSELGRKLREEGATSDGDTLRVLRNKLSHGAGTFDPWQLKDWVTVVEDLARAQLARLLGVSPESVTASNGDRGPVA